MIKIGISEIMRTHQKSLSSKYDNNLIMDYGKYSGQIFKNTWIKRSQPLLWNVKSKTKKS
ncbi:hypothetical protein MXB_5542 [Myxobolus squamalis]|nr:hypothetical protein MXB_5542 [Myxobolus squamalis]